MKKFTENKDYVKLFYAEWENIWLTQKIRLFRNKATAEISPVSMIIDEKDATKAKVKVFANETALMTSTAAFETVVDLIKGNVE